MTAAIRLQAGLLDRSRAYARYGTISSVDPDAYTARALLQPDGVLTGWLPVLSPWVGAGWGMACPPSPGDQVLIIPQEGDGEHGVIVGCGFSTVQRPPTAGVGELWLVHQSGSSLRLLNDGTVRIKGDLHVDGDIFDRTGSMGHLRETYNQHTHPISSNSWTAPPVPED